MTEQKTCGSCRWWGRQDSNLQPGCYEQSALTVELRPRPAPYASSGGAPQDDTLHPSVSAWRHPSADAVRR